MIRERIHVEMTTKEVFWFRYLRKGLVLYSNDKSKCLLGAVKQEYVQVNGEIVIQTISILIK